MRREEVEPPVLLSVDDDNDAVWGGFNNANRKNRDEADLDGWMVGWLLGKDE